MIAVAFVWFATLLHVARSYGSEPHVEIRQGILKGSTHKTWSGQTFLAFQSIPYAEPPVGNRRFQPPVPGKSWRGVFDATKPHAACPQVSIFLYNNSASESEDCLFLNVYTPNTTDLLPVVFFIHGGGFMCDDSNMDMYGPHILLDRDIVLVTFNYRLGAFGFLSLEDEALPGNNGLKDQSLALRWVKDNIRSFGGNPDSVTIFGNSAGGASVYYHVLSPLSKGLFHAAISSSGIATSTWALTRKGVAREFCRKLADRLNCPVSPSQTTVKCLQAVSFGEISKEVLKLLLSDLEHSMLLTPIIEPKLPGAFISDHPVDVIRSGKFSHVPYMTGITTNDGALLSARMYSNPPTRSLNEDFEDTVSTIFYYENLTTIQNVSKEIRKFYVQDKPFDHNTKADLTDIGTDVFFYYPARATIELHAKYSTQPVYFYLFGYRGSYTHLSDYGDTSYNYGVVHSDDIVYLLSDAQLALHNSTTTDIQMRTVMTTLIDNFAKRGDPTSKLDCFITQKWEPVKRNKFNYYAIMGPNDLRTESTLYEERYNFWRKLPVFCELHDELLR
ncbi:venom carboxylesterase-6-like [Photinus pyralis]|uniref:venom carboxylesterase-6-like n=1 Tax=Photinus pyralis TaxID=7054 RepID=UPI001266EF04|nr:venom carboxylesterase-6-like [Photinus pyralis]XP_031345689.1 venom carboxylesterase-6-like [Photinus pyralis]